MPIYAYAHIALEVVTEFWPPNAAPTDAQHAIMRVIAENGHEIRRHETKIHPHRKAAVKAAGKMLDERGYTYIRA